MRICIIIPILNEAKAIAAIVQELKKKKLDVIVVDDGSSDDSGNLARNAGAHVITHEYRRGKGASLKAAFVYAIKNNYEGVITMDGDGQHAIADLDHFLESENLAEDTVITGNRLGNTKGMPLIRIWTNQFMSFLISRVCHQSIPDTQCGYRYIGGDVLRVLELQSDGYEIETEILIRSAKKKFTIHSVAVETIYAGEVSRINPFLDTFKFIIYFIKELFSK